MKLHDNYDVGIYCRLSREDVKNGKRDVSLSIENQQAMLEEYVKEQEGWNVYKVYVDDDVTGTTFNRPSFNDMMKDIEDGKMSCVITKDLSRLGRNYIEAGRHRELFNEHGVRYIAVHDAHDSINDGDSYNISTPIKEIMNEMYAADVSLKVRKTKKLMAKQGKFSNSQAPFGYQKSPQDKHVLIIDEDAAKIVFRLFNDYANGHSARKIAEHMNAEKIDSPRFYHYAKMGRVNPLSEQKNVWGTATVLQLLRNQVYIGSMVQGKREVVSFKTKKVRLVDSENWTVVENTHEPIIPRELWDRVHTHLKEKYRVRETKTEQIGLFAGILKCSDCGSPLAYMRKKYKTIEEKGLYRCSRYNNNGGKSCTPHFIDEVEVYMFVINDIKLHAQLAVSEREQLASRLLSSMKKVRSGETHAIRTKIKETENRLSFIASTLKSLYEDKCAGKLPESVFLNLMGDFTKEQAAIEERLPQLRRELGGIQETTGEINDWLSLIGSYIDIETLDRAMVTGLIEKITVSERVKQWGRNTQEIEIEYRFIKNLLANPNEDIA